MNHMNRKIWNVPEQEHTPYDVYQNRKAHRREFLKFMGYGLGIAGFADLLSGCKQATQEEIEQAGAVEPLPEESRSVYPAPRNKTFEYGRPETVEKEAVDLRTFMNSQDRLPRNPGSMLKILKPLPGRFPLKGNVQSPHTRPG